MSVEPKQIEHFSSPQRRRCNEIDGIFDAFAASLVNDPEPENIPDYKIDDELRIVEAAFCGHRIQLGFMVELSAENTLSGRVVATREAPLFRPQKDVIGEFRYGREGLIEGLYSEGGSALYVGYSGKELLWHFLYESMKNPPKA